MARPKRFEYAKCNRKIQHTKKSSCIVWPEDVLQRYAFLVYWMPWHCFQEETLIDWLLIRSEKSFMKYKNDMSLNMMHSLQSLTTWALSNRSIANWVMIVTESGVCYAEITSIALLSIYRVNMMLEYYESTNPRYINEDNWSRLDAISLS